ncbi:MAG: ATP-dependent helicase [Armatimonadetes bacterium]|nr:ATP-dependent helicase [Armatimonadota bacterium]
MTWSDGLAGTALAIAECTASPLRVMAGPGTGKSFVVKRRVARLLEEGCDPRNILAVTFTRNAAADLLADLRSLGVEGCEHIQSCTLHSLCFSLLTRRAVFDFLGRTPRPIVTFAKSGVLQYEGRSLVADLAAEESFGTRRDCTKRIRAFEAAWARLQSESPGWPEDPVDQLFHRSLLEWLRFHRAMLIGEVVPEALRYLRNNPASDAVQRYGHVLVDEYQDLNRAEQELVDLVAGEGTITVVGDVDQSIYRFRHANPEGIARFRDTHPTTQDETLGRCRRCPTRVVAIADRLIRQNHPGEPTCRLEPMPDGSPGEVHVVQWHTTDEEALGLAQYVSFLLENGGHQPSDILVLTPRRLLGYQIRDKIKELGIPVHSFYHEESLEDESAQEAFSLLTLLADPSDRTALRWWLGKNSDSCLTGSYRALRQHCEATGQPPWEALRSQQATTTIPRVRSLLPPFSDLQTRLTDLRALDLSQLIDSLLPADEEALQTLREISLLALPFMESVEQLFSALKTAVTQPEMPQHGDYVRVMSLHKSKGLTSRVVIVSSCVQGLIPHVDRDLTPLEQQANLEEQRRLFYVAMTRCSDKLVLSSAISLDRALAHRIGAQVRYGRSPVASAIASQFLNELGPDAPQAKTGVMWRATSYQL